MKTNETILHLGGRVKASPEEILLLKADVNYTQVFFCDGSHFLSSTSLGVLERRLQSSGQFFRPNRSYIINLSYVAEFEVFSNLIKMENATTISLSRRKAKLFVHIANPKTEDQAWPDLSW
ncbi:MAG: LytTR family transcriptional regulator [Spirosomaceae bacterium]|jgi:two-component system LytT family response regulator|nr:LytTR family transcriptional regulator [Spirosomataceae bacterium]